ncbi:MAG: FkbM family methyltransferase [Planctomycetota bacterium]|nr:FkbM family methyltransferase [Planctomycetota bacterium]
MHTPRMIYNPKLVPMVFALPKMAEADVFLLDVGASGGIPQSWKAWSPHLKAIGFDPLVNEIDRLNRENADPKIEYVEGFVGENGKKRSAKSPGLDPMGIFERASMSLVHNYEERAKQYFNSNGALIYSERNLSLNSYIDPSQHKDVDFIKVDTDGHDLAVLKGASRILREGVLGVSVEILFHGQADADGNDFASIDAFLVQQGFLLYDLEVYRCSRASLPSEFAYDFPGQTRHGQLVWGDSVYFKDFGDHEYEKRWNVTADETKILKLACMFEQFGLSDCAVELILKYADRFESLAQPTPFLNALTSNFDPNYSEYAPYVEAFRKDPKSFYPSARNRSNSEKRRRTKRTFIQRMRRSFSKWMKGPK